MANKLSFTVRDPDKETIDFVGRKIFDGYLRELRKAATKANNALAQGRSGTFRTKPLTIQIEQTTK